MKSDDDFKRDLERSWQVVDEFIEVYRKQGYMIESLPRQFRPDASVRMQYRDEGDGRIELPFEHKQKFLTWDDRASFDRDDFRIDEVYKVDEIISKPCLGFVFTDRRNIGMAIVYRRTQPFWYKKTYDDKYQQRMVEAYYCPLKYVRFGKVGEPLI